MGVVYENWNFCVSAGAPKFTYFTAPGSAEPFQIDFPIHLLSDFLLLHFLPA